MTSGRSSNSYACDHCGAAETNEAQLSKCTGCNKELYCSEHCQHSAWKSHRKRCRKASDKVDTLVLDDERVPNFDLALNYASKYMRNLKHVKLRINDDHENEKGIIVSADVLESFLKSKKGMLETLHWSMDDFCMHCGREKTKDGSVWTELHGLKVLWMEFPVFTKCHNLVKVIQQQQSDIMSLALSGLVIGKDAGMCSRNDCRALATAISQCKHIVRLELNDNFLRDTDVEIMLPRLPNLRILLVGGKVGGYLTDKSCKVISRTCPDLQELDIWNHPKITVSGVKRVCKSCHHLRLLQTSASMQRKDVQSLLCSVPKLLFLCMNTLFDEEFYVEIVEATGGRLVPNVPGELCLFDADALSNAARREHQWSRDLLLMVSECLHDPDIVNEWEDIA